MFLRKLLGSNNDRRKDAENVPPAGVQAMGATLQRKFAKGIQYNMKLVIKGDRNVGKTCLFQRLQGQKFKEEYIPTDEIQVASIQWNYKATDDVVKVEVWDVVDKGKKKKKLEGLKISAEEDVFEDACLDAEFIDVYKGTHGVILIMDITKQWTFDYVVREMEKIPPNLPVLILANHRDMGHHRTVNEDKVRYYIEELDRGHDSGPVRFAEASMRNGFGLKYIHKFFNLPFLRLQRDTLLKQLETNTREIELTIEELDLHEESDEQNYDTFIDALSDKRREQAEKLAETALKEAKVRQEEEKVAKMQAAVEEARKNPKSMPSTPATTPSAQQPKGPLGLKEAPPAKPIPGMHLPVSSSTNPSPNTQGATLSSLATSKSAPVTPATTPNKDTVTDGAGDSGGGGGFMSRIFGSGKSKEKEKEEPESPAETPVFPASNVVRSIDDFTPEEGLDASFLDDLKDPKPVSNHNESSSDEEVGNPMVAGFQDDIDSEDDIAARAPITMATTDQLSSDDDDDVVSNVKGHSPSDMKVTVDEDYADEIAEKTSKRDFNTVPLVIEEVGKKNKKTKSNSSSNASPLTLSSEEETMKNSQTNSISNKSSNKGGANLIINGKTHPTDTVSSSSNSSSNSSKAKVPKQLEFSSPAKTDNHDLDDSNDESNAVQVMGDIEDVSEAEETPVKPALPVLTVEEDTDDNEEEEAPAMVSSLQFEDLSVLEKGFDFKTGMPRPASVGSDLMSSSRQDTDTESDANNSLRKKKKKSRDKDKPDGERSQKKKKKKDRDRDKDTPDGGRSDDKEKKKKKKSKKREEEKKKEMDELEAFLGSGAGDGQAGGEGYESL